jgi:hypothetical protein
MQRHSLKWRCRAEGVVVPGSPGVESLFGEYRPRDFVSVPAHPPYR